MHWVVDARVQTPLGHLMYPVSGRQLLVSGVTGYSQLGLSSRGSSGCARLPSCSHQCVYDIAYCLTPPQLSQFLPICMGMDCLGSVSEVIPQSPAPKVGNCVCYNTFHSSYVFWSSLSPYTSWSRPTIYEFSICSEGLGGVTLSHSYISSLSETCPVLEPRYYSVLIGIWPCDNVIGGYSCQCCPPIFAWPFWWPVLPVHYSGDSMLLMCTFLFPNYQGTCYIPGNKTIVRHQMIFLLGHRMWRTNSVGCHMLFWPSQIT